MRKFVSLLAVLAIFCIPAYSQVPTITGRIIDEKGSPVPFATVTIKGTKTGTTSDINGVFNIKANTGDVLEITAVGQKPAVVTVGSESSLNVTLEASLESSLKEVVVTSAYNTKRTARSTSFNAQNITEEQLNTIRQTDLNNAMAGKVAGLQVRSQSKVKLGDEGYSTVRLRGESNITASSSVLYVVDGTVVPSSGDINPDDIEDITVLQGPAASSIFGPQGANGAIVINTKKARKGDRGIGVEANLGATFDKIYILPDYQNSYAGGGISDLIRFDWKPGMPEEWQALDGKYYHDYSDDASWGPRMIGQEYIPWYAWYPGTPYSYKTTALVPQPNNARDFYNTGVTLNNNVSFSKAGDNYNFRFSYTNFDIQGLLPNTSQKRNNITLNATVDLNKKLSLITNINYMNQVTRGEFNDGYANQSSGAFNQWFHRNLDVKLLKQFRNLKTPEGILASWNHKNPESYSASNPLQFYGGNYWYNLYSFFDNINNTNNRDRLFGFIALQYKITNDLTVRATYRKQQLTTFYENKVYTILETSATQTGVKAGYATGETYSNRENFEGLLTYTKKIKDFSINANLGFDIFRSTYKDIRANTNNGLNVPDFFDLANSKNPISYDNRREKNKYRAGFVRGDLGYKNLVFVEFALRQDYFSTLPVDDNGIFSKSFGLSFVFSDLIKQDLPWLSFGKLRASWGEVPQAINPYVLGFNYAVATNQWDGNFIMNTPDRLVDPNISGSVTTQREIGVDLRFVNNRIGISATYWDGTVKDIPLDININGASGFTRKLVNAGEISKKGIDLQFNAIPLRSREFEWQIFATWGRLLENEVVKLAPGLDRITFSSGTFAGSYAAYVVNERGKPWGQLFGPGFKRINGKPQLTSSGLYVREPEVLFGSVLPDFTGGVQNQIVYKNFLFSFNIDYQQGGKFFSLSDFWGSFSGLTAKTATINDKGNPVRDPVEEGGGVHVFGVDENGKDVNYYVDAQTYFHQFQGSRISENSVYDLTFVKLREVSLGYSFNVEKLGLGKTFTRASISIVSRNPWLIYAKTRDFDPSEISNTYGENGQFPGTRSIGFNIKLGF